MTSDGPDLVFDKVGEADPVIQEATVELIYASFREFYDLLEIPSAELTAYLLADLLVDHSESSTSIAALNAAECVGLVAAYPQHEIQDRQQVSVLNLLSRLSEADVDRVLDIIETYRKDVPPIPPGSFYLARFAVASNCRAGVFRRSYSRNMQGAEKNSDRCRCTFMRKTRVPLRSISGWG